MREGKLVSTQKTGRQVVYELADPGLELLPPLLDSITGRVHAPDDEVAPGIPSRTCYDHLGGEIAVDLYRGLLAGAALIAGPDGIVELGPNATETFRRIGVDPRALPPKRQRLAFECLDATQRAPHLAGALGDAIAQALTERGWVTHSQTGREYVLTPNGQAGLRRVLGADPHHPK